jgi:hypothetical protein
MWETSSMINEAERSNVAAAVLKFLAVSLIIVGAGSFLLHFVHSLQLALNTLTERLVHLII